MIEDDLQELDVFKYFPSVSHIGHGNDDIKQQRPTHIVVLLRELQQ